MCVYIYNLAARVCPNQFKSLTYRQHGDTCVAMTGADLNWDASLTECRMDSGSELVVITDSTFNTFIMTQFSGSGWIGYNDRLSEGTFKWHDGNPVNM